MKIYLPGIHILNLLHIIDNGYDHEVVSLISGVDENGKLVYFMDENDVQEGSYAVQITYPLSTHVEFNINITKLTLIGEVLIQIAKKYRAIYNNESEYGIWGHGLGDLEIGQLQIQDGKINLEVDS